MTTIAEKLTTIRNAFRGIKQSIINKGGTVSGDVSTYATAIDNIPSGGSTPVINSLNVTPTTSVQTISAPSGVNGYNPVNVSAVTSSIDSNISANNIVSGVSILGVSGSATVLNATTESITPTTSSQTITPNSPYNGFSSVTVNAVTSSIDSNITAANIKKNVVILGVTGSYEGSGGGSSTKYGASIDSLLGDVDANGNLSHSTVETDLVFTGVRSIDSHVLYYKFSRLAIKSVSFPALVDVDSYALYFAFENCASLTSVSFPALTTVFGTYAFYGAFDGCKGLTSVSFPALTTVSGNNAFSLTFERCTGLTSVSFPVLTSVNGSNVFYNIFRSTAGLTDVYFNALTTNSFGTDYKSQFVNMMASTGKTITHTLHFPSNLESTISGLTGYPTFGGNATYISIVFDLPATS